MANYLLSKFSRLLRSNRQNTKLPRVERSSLPEPPKRPTLVSLEPFPNSAKSCSDPHALLPSQTLPSVAGKVVPFSSHPSRCLAAYQETSAQDLRKGARRSDGIQLDAAVGDD